MSMDEKNVKFFYEHFDFEKMIDPRAPKLIQDFLVGEINFIMRYIKPNSSILEIGCGYGRLLKILNKKSSNLIGIDFSKRMVKLSKQNIIGLNNVSVKLMDANKLLFQNDSFDYVVCLDNSFGNMPNIELDVLKEIKRVCKPNGKIIISVFSENAKAVQEENYRRIGLSNIQDNGNAICTSEGFYSRRFTKNELNDLFKKINLSCEITKICPVNYIAYSTKIN